MNQHITKLIVVLCFEYPRVASNALRTGHTNKSCFVRHVKCRVAIKTVNTQIMLNAF